MKQSALFTLLWLTCLALLPEAYFNKARLAIVRWIKLTEAGR